jgi:hypothetical protein
MSSLLVSENIRLIEENMRKLKEQSDLIKIELSRLEGSLRVFKNLQDLGVETIQVPKDVVDNSEVIDTSN